MSTGSSSWSSTRPVVGVTAVVHRRVPGAGAPTKQRDRRGARAETCRWKASTHVITGGGAARKPGRAARGVRAGDGGGGSTSAVGSASAGTGSGAAGSDSGCRHWQSGTSRSSRARRRSSHGQRRFRRGSWRLRARTARASSRRAAIFSAASARCRAIRSALRARSASSRSCIAARAARFRSSEALTPRSPSRTRWPRLRRSIPRGGDGSGCRRQAAQRR